ncbi:MAG TPA: methyltransferase domain-containing protein [Solirubrobacteraceae bacterium]|nr:methyltransferase domain-containing protein [Solirubrobacteraceae bacterium]
MGGTDSETAADAHAAVAAVKRWYHCIDVAPGLVTPGLFDLRPIVSRLPWPEVSGLRCLDVGTSDGFLAFELERRGAAEVRAVDLAAHEQWDWEAHMGAHGPGYLRAVSGPSMSDGFRVARELRGSAVQFSTLSVYDLTPEEVGRFDVVMCGSLLLHLRDPLRALAALRSVCRGRLLCTNQIDLARSVGPRRTPLVRLDGTSGITQWWIPNAAGHRQMLQAAGFALERQSPLYSVPFGPAHPPRGRDVRSRLRGLAERALTGNEGVPHVALLARPA